MRYVGAAGRPVTSDPNPTKFSVFGRRIQWNQSHGEHTSINYWTALITDAIGAIVCGF